VCGEWNVYSLFLERGYLKGVSTLPFTSASADFQFRGWLDDLLRSSWEGCQNSDLLIESPSAMGGVHIAEALRIPYYRAFTVCPLFVHDTSLTNRCRGREHELILYVSHLRSCAMLISSTHSRYRNTRRVERTIT